jgi:hypothetical protein
VSVPVWSMTPAEQRAALVDLTVLENHITTMKLQVLAEADRSGATAEQGDGTAADGLSGLGVRQLSPSSRPW